MELRYGKGGRVKVTMCSLLTCHGNILRGRKQGFGAGAGKRGGEVRRGKGIGVEGKGWNCRTVLAGKRGGVKTRWPRGEEGT